VYSYLFTLCTLNCQDWCTVAESADRSASRREPRRCPQSRVDPRTQSNLAEERLDPKAHTVTCSTSGDITVHTNLHAAQHFGSTIAHYGTHLFFTLWAQTARIRLRLHSSRISRSTMNHKGGTQQVAAIKDCCTEGFTLLLLERHVSWSFPDREHAWLQILYSRSLAHVMRVVMRITEDGLLMMHCHHADWDECRSTAILQEVRCITRHAVSGELCVQRCRPLLCS
jgi:hypothetical protein